MLFNSYSFLLLFLLAARLEWRTTFAWGLAMAILAVAGVLSLSQATQFLYYQF